MRQDVDTEFRDDLLGMIDILVRDLEKHRVIEATHILGIYGV